MTTRKELLRYRLQPMLEMKIRAKKRAEIQLAQALARLEEARKKLKRLEEEKEEIITRRKACRQELHRKVLTGRAKAQDGSVRVNFLRKLEEDEKKKQEEIEAQKRHIEACQEQVKRARRDYINACKELRILEKHKELWKKKVEKELMILEEREMDELSHAIHQLKVSEHRASENFEPSEEGERLGD